MEQTDEKTSSWGFQPLGDRRFIDENGAIVTNVTTEIDNQRKKEFEERTLTQIQTFVDAHISISYAKAITPELCIKDTSNTAGT